jgi:fructokinase
MAYKRYLIVGLGELLWDLFPEGKHLGGAPANFAYISTLLGNEGSVASCVGEDELGAEALKYLSDHSLNCTHIQRTSDYPTGTVNVEVNSGGQPNFEISHPVAWDFLAWTEDWQQLAGRADAICFGSLAQRSPQSRKTIQLFVEHTRSESLRVFDVNLRQKFYSADVLRWSCEHADLVKMNDEEFPEVLRLLGLPHKEIMESARGLCDVFNLKLVCISRGQNGSLLITKKSSHAHPGIAVKVMDTVGAGDAFTAGLVYEYLRNISLDEEDLTGMNETANRIGAWVASNPGAMPEKLASDLVNYLVRK